MFKKILIANRGEIAVRIIAACKELGIKSAAVYSEIDFNSMHAALSDEAYFIGPPAASQSYLNIDKIISLAKKIGADAIHPGYGFLSENPVFISEVEKSGITFIGPSAKSVEMMGNKTAARTLMNKHNVPIVPGTTQTIKTIDEVKEEAGKIGYPVMLKAAAGGGGKGMRLVNNPDDLQSAFDRAKNEALKAFGNPDIYLEKFIENPKHIEVQIIGDKFGNYAHIFERECSIQRRHQKVVEESPSVFVDENLRKEITQAAVKAAKACGYYNAGTVEFLMDKNKNFYFLEMNTRLQVEHPVTELVSGIDLVKEQIKIAAGEKLSFSNKDLTLNGHAIECRIYAEDIHNNFAPSTGKIEYHSVPSGPGIRIDRGIETNSVVPVYYDPLLAKVITWGKTRYEAINRMKRALAQYQILGVTTNTELFTYILNSNDFLNGTFDINFLENVLLSEINGLSSTEISKQTEEAAVILSALLKQVEMEKLKTGVGYNGKNKWVEQKYE